MLVAGRPGDPAARAPRAGARPHAVALGPRARPAGGARAPRRPDRPAGGALRDGVGRTPAARRTAPWTSTSTSCGRSWPTPSRSGGSSTPTSGSAIGSSRSLHIFFTGREHPGNRVRAGGLRGSAATTTKKEGLMRSTRYIPALAAAAALAIGVAACGSDNSSTAARAAAGARPPRAQLGGSLNGAGATFPQPVYQEWAARFQKDVRHDRQLPGHRLRRRRGPVHGRHGRLRRVRLGDDRRGDRGRPEEGRARCTSRPCSARSRSPTTSAASSPGSSSTAPTIADIFLGKITKWNDPKIAGQNSGVNLPGAAIIDLPPLRRVGHDEELHRVPGRLLGRVEERPGRRQVGQVAGRHRRQGQ